MLFSKNVILDVQSLLSGLWKKKNDVKKIHNILLPSLDLASFIEEYEDHKRKPYNLEWKDFFKCLLDYDEKNPDESNLVRNDIRSQNHTILNAGVYYKMDIFDYLVKAISRGKTPEIYLEKLRSTKICEQNLIKTNLLIIEKNINTILNATSNLAFFERNICILKQLRLIFNDYIFISDNGTLTMPIDLSFPKRIVQNTELLMDELNKPYFKQNLLISVLKSDIENVVSLYTNQLINNYETKGDSNNIKRLGNLHEQIKEIIKTYSLPGILFDFRPTELSDIRSNKGIYWRDLTEK